MYAGIVKNQAWPASWFVDTSSCRLRKTSTIPERFLENLNKDLAARTQAKSGRPFCLCISFAACSGAFWIFRRTALPPHHVKRPKSQGENTDALCMLVHSMEREN